MHELTPSVTVPRCGWHGLRLRLPDRRARSGLSSNRDRLQFELWVAWKTEGEAANSAARPVVEQDLCSPQSARLDVHRRFDRGQGDQSMLPAREEHYLKFGSGIPRFHERASEGYEGCWQVMADPQPAPTLAVGRGPRAMPSLRGLRRRPGWSSIADVCDGCFLRGRSSGSTLPAMRALPTA